MEKLTVCWKNGKITETITDDLNWYIHLLRSNKKVYRWYIIQQSDLSESNLHLITENIKFLSTN